MKTRIVAWSMAATLALAVCGCAAPGGSESGTSSATTSDSSSVVASSSSSEASSSSSSSSSSVSGSDSTTTQGEAPVVDGWVRDAFDYFENNGGDKDVVIEVTGMMTKGSANGTESTLILVDPLHVDTSKLENPEDEIELQPDDKYMEVHFVEPIEVTRWPHLIGIRGTAHLDGNKIVVQDAVEVED